MMGFLTHCGYSHGGKGFAGIAFLLEQFDDVDLADPGNAKHGVDLRAMAMEFARAYRQERSAAKEAEASALRALPGVRHPIFRGEAVNYDPREQFIANYLAERGEYNIFHTCYRELMQALCDVGASRYVFCVNVDAMIGALLLALSWKDYRNRCIGTSELEVAAFNVFLYGRMIGAAAEIDDHLNRGRNMDMRTL
jgi:citrate synthase